MTITRRDILRLGMGAATSAFAAGAQSAQEHNTRPIPSSGERLPVIGIGECEHGLVAGPLRN